MDRDRFKGSVLYQLHQGPRNHAIEITTDRCSAESLW
jgi:hypothetical protein